MEERQIPSFDIVVCTPILGWGSWNYEDAKYPVPVFLSVFYPMLQNVYGLLSPNEGTIYTEIPPGMGLSTADLKVWEWRMNRRQIPTRVAETEGGYRTHVAQITKLPESPDLLVPLIGRFKMSDD